MYQVDAFASKLFSGNPAAVVILESPLSEDLMQSIAFLLYSSDAAAERQWVVFGGRRMVKKKRCVRKRVEVWYN